jgi:hypothetical protein
MDWSGKQATAKKLIDKFGVAMQVIYTTPSAYNATTDSVTSTIVTYDTIGVILNPTMVSPQGVYSKSDRVRLLLNGSALPALDAIEFYVLYGTTTWKPDTVAVVKPGGDAILYAVDMK